MSIYQEFKLPQKKIKEIVQKTLDVILAGLINNCNIELRNFGVFKIKVRKKCIGRNPNMPKKDILVPERKIIKFKASKALKFKLNSQLIK